MRFAWTLATIVLFSPCSSIAADAPVPEGRRLREIVEDKYPGGNVYVGGTTGWKKRPRGSGAIIDREFGYVTPENDFKQSTAHPEPGKWNWELGDAWVKHCKENGQVIRLHGPISPQCSKWAKDDSRTAEELKQNLIEYMTALCKRYDKYEHVKWMDVINETVLSNGQWFGPRKGVSKWENPWTKIGYDETHPLRPPLYIKMAFEIATRHAPNTKLVINQHGGMEPAMWSKVKALVPYLRKQGLRVDGIGWQAHIDTGWEKNSGDMKRLNELIDWAHANELSFHVTEMNSWLKGKKKNYDAQARTFGAIMTALLEHRANGVVTWNVWNITDGLAWTKNRHKEGTLFDADGKAKPGYSTIQKSLENPPAIQVKPDARDRTGP
jgi:endo-1,4-beta-xylanase